MLGGGGASKVTTYTRDEVVIKVAMHARAQVKTPI